MRIRIYPQSSFGIGGFGYRRRRSYGYGYGYAPRIQIRPVGGWGVAHRGIARLHHLPTERQLMAEERAAERFAARSVRGLRRAMRLADVESRALLSTTVPPFGYASPFAFAPAWAAYRGVGYLGC